ncbi:MAG: DNA polymerase III subunit alpha, partial [Schleiferiaceae bacterium]|nr:DNA polymerase III subunit alpha [Schleiferiaceae bacterium]
MFLIFDTETTGLPKNYNLPYTDTDNWPRMVQLAWQLHDEEGKLIEVKDYIVKPVGYDIPFNATKIHGISTKKALEEGHDLKFVLEEFEKDLERADYNVGHNIGFDINIVGCEAVRTEHETLLHDKIILDTCTEQTAEYCKIPGGRGGKFKLPTLTELHHLLFNEGFDEAHNAAFDVEATTRSFLELLRRGIFTPGQLNVTQDFLERFKEANPEPFKAIGLAVEDKAIRSEKSGSSKGAAADSEKLADLKFAHLHNHTQFSILQSTTKVDDLVDTALRDGAPGVAITDLGNLMAAFHFNQKVLGIPENKEVADFNKKVDKGEEAGPYKDYPFKGIIGCELFVTDDHKDRSRKNNGHQMVFLAKNKEGYHNLAKLSSIGHIEGFYYVPRVDKELVEEYKEGLIVLSGGVSGEIANLILNVGEGQAEKALEWWKDQFGEDFYLELSRHGLEDEDHANDIMLGLAEKHEVKVVAANNTFYATKEDADAHDILLCVKEGEYQSTPKGRGRGFRYGFPNEEFYLKSQDDMKKLFADVPESVESIQEILDKVEMYQLARDVVLPAFDIPEEFQHEEDEKDGGKRGENAFLKHLTYKGAEKRYDEITEDIKERLDFELETIERTGYPGYFLIVQDFCEAARQMDVSVGPGRGSAAGSAVAYCIGITNVDPIKYDLLFERFLNPERVSLPDIDIDFDDEGRERVIQYVIDKYGASQVAQIITYGTMAAKSSIKDCGRVLELPLGETEKIAKLVPDMMKLNKLFKMDDKVMGEKLKGDQIAPAKELIALADNKNLEGTIVRQALKLEGSVRNTGIHACGVIITPRDIRGLVPVSTAKDSDMWCTQFDNSVVEDAGLLKMDFLGLKTLTIIKEACRLVKNGHGVDLDPDNFPLDDEETYALFQRGETIG